MRIVKLAPAAVGLVIAHMGASLANAQFNPFVSLPDTDFVLHWGRTFDDPEDRRAEDFSMNGSEGGFRCALKGTFSPSNNMTEPEINEFERNLQSTLYFIQEAVYVMNELDLSHDIDWAELNCVKFQPTEADAQEVQERVDRAREKAIEDMLRRREKRAQDAARGAE